MGRFVHAPLDTIEESLDSMRYGDLEMDDVADILLRLVKELRDHQRAISRASNEASCLANGILPD